MSNRRLSGVPLYLLFGFVLCQGCRGSQTSAAPAEPQASAAPAEPQASAAPVERSMGAKQPKWTMIDGVKACTGTILTMFVCTPSKKPAQCSEKAWQELNALTGKEALTPCALEPDIMACTAPLPDDPNSRCVPEPRPASCTDEKWQRVKGDALVNACIHK